MDRIGLRGAVLSKPLVFVLSYFRAFVVTLFSLWLCGYVFLSASVAANCRSSTSSRKAEARSCFSLIRNTDDGWRVTTTRPKGLSKTWPFALAIVIFGPRRAVGTPRTLAPTSNTVSPVAEIARPR